MQAGRPLRVAVAGATGYMGMQAVALLARHPGVELCRLLARSQAGRRFSDAVPGSDVDLPLEAGLDVAGADVVVAALPHTVAASCAAAWLEQGAIVVDLSADFRLRDVDAYRRWYGVEHPAPQLCERAVYGLCELDDGRLADADIIGVPGCYPTAALLATAPAVRAGLVESSIVVDAKSGVSGSGRSPQLGNLFAEVNESVHAYSVGGHRHKAEMLQELGSADSAIALTFVPHLVPMSRGILATAYLRPRPGVDTAQLRAVYADFCAAHPFLFYTDAPPRTKQVTGTNRAVLSVDMQDDVGVVTCAIDNLVKGGAGQGVQALNLRFGLDETAGLGAASVWP